MTITSAQAYLPKPLKAEMDRQPQSNELPVGFLVGVDDLLAQRPAFSASLAKIRPGTGLLSSACLVVPPEQTASIFSYEKELDLLKTIASQIAAQVHPHLKTGIDTIWLIYKAAKLYDDWQKPESDKLACLFKLGGLAVGTMGVAGRLDSNLKLPDHWANGVNFVLKSGEAIYQGKTLPMNEMILSRDRRIAIPLKLLKVAGIALDPQPELKSLTPLPLSHG